MTLTELRDTLAAVSEAVPVPGPDVVAFQREVRRHRRRRTAGVAAGVAAAVVVAAGGTTIVLERGDDPHPPVTQRPPDDAVPPSPELPVLLSGSLRMLQPDGTLGGPGPDVRSIAGTTARGVV